MLDRRSFLGAGGAAVALRSPAAAHRVRARPPPTAASSSSSSAAPPTGWRRGADRRPGLSRRCAARSPRISRTAPSSTASSRCIRRWPRPAQAVRGEARPCSSMRSPRPIATARISTGRTCSRPAAPPPTACKDGWMNRLLGLLPPDEAKALALSPTVPMALRGATRSSSYAPSALPDATGRPAARVGELYASDPQLHGLWTRRWQTRMMAGRPRRRRRAERRRDRRARREAALRRRRPADRDDRDRRLGHPHRPARPAQRAAARPRRSCLRR